jgi:hypothetical protein
MGEPGSEVYAFELYATEYPPPSEEDERPLPLSRCRSGSEIYATPPSPTTAPSSTGVEASKTGGSPPTSLGTAPPRSESGTCTPPRRASKPASPGSERAWTSSRSAWGPPERGSALGRYRNLVDVVPSSQHNNTRRRGRFCDQGRGRPQN